MAAHQRNGTLGRNAGARAALAEHHGDCLAGQRGAEGVEPVVLGDLAFAGCAIADQLDKLGGCEVVDGREMARFGGGRGV